MGPRCGLPQWVKWMGAGLKEQGYLNTLNLFLPDERHKNTLSGGAIFRALPRQGIFTRSRLFSILVSGQSVLLESF